VARFTWSLLALWRMSSRGHKLSAVCLCPMFGIQLGGQRTCHLTTATRSVGQRCSIPTCKYHTQRSQPGRTSRGTSSACSMLLYDTEPTKLRGIRRSFGRHLAAPHANIRPAAYNSSRLCATGFVWFVDYQQRRSQRNLKGGGAGGGVPFLSPFWRPL